MDLESKSPFRNGGAFFVELKRALSNFFSNDFRVVNQINKE